MSARQELIDGRLRLELADDAGHRRAVMMQFGFFHPPLAICVVKELNHTIERLFRVVNDIGKRLPLRII
ncbi:MAG: hypothetical protein WD070_03580 [Pirellulaceae bacterium]